MTSPPFLRHDLLDQAGIAHGFFTRHGGHGAGLYASLNGGLGSADDPAVVNANRRAAAAALGGNGDDIRGLYQIHSATALLANGEARREGDGIATATPGQVLTILTADCAPVLIADADARVIGAAHAGWRGAVAGILAATVTAMEQLGARRQAMRAVVGPTIQQASYQVGEDLRQAVLDASPWAGEYFTPDEKPGHFRFDLPGYTLAQLRGMEIESAAMPEDTYSDERFFSHRRACHQHAADTGRLMSMIRLTPDFP